ncbi:MAG: isoprenoid biosynthesis glyoxalase ElbB [Chlamydiia bacterium]
MRAAVVFSGCGHKDGTEISEGVLTLMALEKRGIEWEGFAPEGEFTAHSHLHEGKGSLGERSFIEEAARITRGNIHPLKDLKVDKFDLICLPGGFGAALHLSNFAKKGFNGEVLEELDKILRAFHTQRKPIVAVCIAPAIVAMALKDAKVTITLGTDTATYQEQCSFAHFKAAEANECVVDRTNRVITTPAFMIEEPSRFLVAIGIDKALEEAVDLIAD